MTHPLAAVARRLAPPPAGSDADLLARYRLVRDEAAFAALVRRHAPAVRAVARARLANPADADDVTQATFLVLARDAGRVRESVVGFLVRVAHLTALQHRRNLARRRTEPLPEHLPMSADPADAAAAREAVAVVAEELAALPDKLRAVLALCALDGLTAAVAAERLGVPKGTVDTRLATAKRRLAARLTRRGLAAGSVAALSAVPASAEFADTISQAACGYAVAAGFAPTAASLLADGVHPAMFNTARLFALGMVAAALTGTAGTALYQSSPADDKPSTKSPPADPKPPAAILTVTAPEPPTSARSPLVQTEDAVRAALVRPAPAEVATMNLGLLFDWLFETYGLVVRIDAASIERLLPFPEGELVALYDKKLQTARPRGMTVAELLAEVASMFNTARGRYTFQVRGGQMLMVPAYQPSEVTDGGRVVPNPALTEAMLIEQMVGPPVSVALDRVALPAAVKRLRELTGANIVVDARVGTTTGPITGTFDDVRLLTVLQILADQVDLRPVVLDNVFYLTSPENADRLQKRAGPKPHAQPAPPAAKK